MIFQIGLDTCTGCGICDFVCPADVIHMEPTPEQTTVGGLEEQRLVPVIKYVDHCVTCFQCEIFCPENCIDVNPCVKNLPRPW